MTTRVQTILEKLRELGHEAEDLSDTINSWGLDAHVAGSTVQANLGMVRTLVNTAGDIVRAEQAKFPIEAALTPRVGSFIVTRSGTRFWPLDPRAEDVNPEDIAWSLSMTARFRGHGSRFFSVAEHSLQVARLATMRLDLDGATEGIRGHQIRRAAHDYALVHDAHEAYLADVPRPLRQHLRGWSAITARVDDAVHAAFGLGPISPELAEAVRWADDVALVFEARLLFGFHEPGGTERFDALWGDGGLPTIPTLPPGVSLLRHWDDDVIAGPREELLIELQHMKRRAEAREVEAAKAAVEHGTNPESSGGGWQDELAISIDPVKWCRVCEMDGKLTKAVENGLCGDCIPL